MFVLCRFDGTEGQQIIPVYPVGNFLQEFDLGPMEATNSGNEPGTFFGCYAVF